MILQVQIACTFHAVPRMKAADISEIRVTTCKNTMSQSRTPEYEFSLMCKIKMSSGAVHA
jgi:hypothetical protein